MSRETAYHASKHKIFHCTSRRIVIPEETPTRANRWVADEPIMRVQVTNHEFDYCAYCSTIRDDQIEKHVCPDYTLH